MLTQLEYCLLDRSQGKDISQWRADYSEKCLATVRLLQSRCNSSNLRHLLVFPSVSLRAWNALISERRGSDERVLGVDCVADSDRLHLSQEICW